MRSLRGAAEAGSRLRVAPVSAAPVLDLSGAPRLSTRLTGVCRQALDWGTMVGCAQGTISRAGEDDIGVRLGVVPG